jgi:hypothetical protein
MGTWGYRTFENDAASDWLYDLEEAIHVKNKDGETPLDVAKLDFIPRPIARFLRQHGTL